MLRPLASWLSLPLFALAFASAAEPDFKSLVADLGAAPRQHPYLAFDEAGKTAMLDRIHSDPTLSEIAEKVRLEGRRLLLATHEESQPVRDPHTRYTGSDEYTSYVTRNAHHALLLAFLYQITGDQRYAEKAFEHADRVCGVDSWVQSAHRFEVIYTRVWPAGSKDDIVTFTYDITSAGVTRDLAYAYDWLYPALTHDQRNRIRSGLLEKAVTRVRGSYPYFWWNTAARCNWSGICHSGLGLAALTLMNENPDLIDVVEHSCDGVWNLLQHVDQDGGWQEGRGYWAYGMGESTMFMDAIKRMTGGKIDLFKEPALYPHPAEFALYGLTAGFGDGTGAPVGQSYFINKLVAESGDGTAAWYDQRFVRQTDDVWDLIWPTPNVKPVEPTEPSKFFRGINWAVMRKDFGSDAMTVAAKAGFNDDPHHGHLDCGTFGITWHGVNYIGEVARSSYDEQYFGALRWDHEEARTEAHNLVLVNGEEQICAKLKDQPWKEGVGGKITQYGSKPDWGYLEMDPTHAYPGVSLKLWHRWIVLDKAHNITIVLDKVGSAPDAKVQVRFHPNVPFELNGTGVVLHGGAEAGGGGAAGRGKQKGKKKGADQNVAIHTFYTPESGGRRGGGDLAMTVLASAPFKVISGREADMPVTEEPQFTWVPYYATDLTAVKGETVTAAVFGPSGEVTDAKLEQAGDAWTVSYSLAGALQKYTLGESAVTRVTGQ